jgi:hypothetical protein
MTELRILNNHGMYYPWMANLQAEVERMSALALHANPHQYGLDTEAAARLDLLAAAGARLSRDDAGTWCLRFAEDIDATRFLLRWA